jgi:hypothetical protein
MGVGGFDLFRFDLVLLDSIARCQTEDNNMYWLLAVFSQKIVNTKELIVNELESTSEDLLSEVLQFVKSIKRQQPKSISTILRRTPNLEQGKIVMSDDFNEPLPDAF